MKRFSIFALFAFFSSVIFSQTNTWIGGSSGNWSVTTNWSSSHVPTSAEDVIINTTTNINVDVFTSLVNKINSLQITGGVTTTLSCFAGGGGGTRTLQLFSTSVITQGLKIDVGNTLRMDATNASGNGNWNLALTGVAGVVGTIDGTLEFFGSGAGTGNAKLDVYSTASNYANLTVSSTGKILYLSNSGNTTSSPGSYLIILSGAVYEIQKNGGNFPDANWDLNSYAKATGTGNTPPAFNGSTYGNLEWNMPGQTQTLTNFLNKDLSFNNANFINTNSANSNGELRISAGASALLHTLTINGNLDIAVNARLVTSAASVTAGNGGILEVKGNINNAGTITSKGAATTINNLKIIGSTPQIFSNAGTLSGSNLLVSMLNANGLTLTAPLTLPYNLQLISGKIKTDGTNLLTMIDNASWTGGSSTSFVEGPMKKIGHEDFDFPVGVGSIFAPVGLLGTGIATDVFTAEYIRTNPQGVYGTTYAPGINHISFVEYWNVDRAVGTTSQKRVSLTATAQSFCMNIASTFVSHFTGTQWTNEASTSNLTGTSGVYNLGKTTTNAVVTSFSPFTLATDLSIGANPLPIKLVTFNAIKVSSTKSLLKWDLSSVCSNAATFEIEKSADSRTFVTMEKINGNAISLFYSLPDNHLNKGTNFYRLKMTDEDGTVSYSKIVAVINDEASLLITALWPNPAQASINLVLSSTKSEKLHFSIIDISGKTIQHWDLNAAQGSNTISVNIQKLGAGVYQLIVTDNNNKVSSSFIKQ